MTELGFFRLIPYATGSLPGFLAPNEHVTYLVLITQLPLSPGCHEFLPMLASTWM